MRLSILAERPEDAMKKSVIAAIMLPLPLFGRLPGWHGQTGDAGPSLDETVTYIKAVLAQHGCTTIEGGYSTVMWCSTIASSDRCTLRISDTRTITVNKDGSQTVTNLPSYNADLSTFDPTSVKTGPDIDMPPGYESFDKGFAVRAQPSSVGGGIKFPIDDAETAKHLINALSHAITLCGGKKAAF
jgi:hypothetical protein